MSAHPVLHVCRSLRRSSGTASRKYFVLITIRVDANRTQYSKTSCQDIMKGSRFYTIIANPRNLIHRTATNKTANVNKGNQIKAGKKVMKQESSKTTSSSAAASSSGEDKGHSTKHQDSEEGSNSEESTKVKKASRGKKRAREETFVAEDPAGQPPRKKAPVKKRSGA